jgi:hypothetical protein
MFSRAKAEIETTLAVKIAILVTAVAIIALAVILVRAIGWTKPYYRDQHKSSIEHGYPLADRVLELNAT